VHFTSESSLASIISQIENGELKPVKLIDNLCDKLEKWDSRIQAFLPESNRRDRLQKDLYDLYTKFPDPKNRPKLFGIPLGIKDLYHVNGFTTKAGSKLPDSAITGNEASSVSILKNAGALILGKTVTTEFAYFEPGPTRNPLNFNYTPGGSSSGSAAAVAAGFCPAALGTQTIGSIIRPAAFCGIIGFKPSYGRIKDDGIVPFSPAVDHVGFFVQDLASAEILSGILIEDWKSERKYSAKDPVFGIPTGKYLDQASPEVLRTFKADINKIRSIGYKVKQINILNNIAEINNLHQEMIAGEFTQVHTKWYSKFKEIYSKKSSELIEKGFKVGAGSIEKIRSIRIALRKELEASMISEGVDLIISPATKTFAPKGINSTGSPIMNLPWTFCGLPAISIPGEKVENGLLSGLQIIAPFFQDEKLVYILKHLNLTNKL